MCLLGGAGEGPAAWWQEPFLATPLVLFIDTTPPQDRPELKRRQLSGGRLEVEPVFSAPELTNYLFAFGPVAQTSCTSPDIEWKTYRRMPIKIPPEVQPARFCLTAEDLAGNRSAPFEYLLP